MKFLGNVLNGKRNKRLDLGSDLSRSSGSRLFQGSYTQVILWWILMIIQELRSLGGGLRSPSAFVDKCHLILNLDNYSNV